MMQTALKEYAGEPLLWFSGSVQAFNYQDTLYIGGKNFFAPNSQI